MKNKNLLSLFLFCITISCSTDYNKPYSDTPTSGKVNIYADETLRPIADAEKDTFMGLYRYSKLNVTYASENDCFNALLLDSAKVIFSSRRLNTNEESIFKAKKLIPVTTKVAYDALALIINNENQDSAIKISQIKSILNGETKSWKSLNSKSSLNDISFVFDKNGSSTVRFLQDSILNGSNFSSNCFAAKSNSDVVDYVEKHKNAIGVIGVSWISDGDDPATKRFLAKVRVMDIASKDDAVFPDDYYKPYQAYIALKQYPLIREVYMISREGRTGLGTGFVSFVAGDQGQRIVRLSGLLPATMPLRIIKVN